MRLMNALFASLFVAWLLVFTPSPADAQRRKIDCTQAEADYIRDGRYYDTLEVLGTTLYSGYIETNNQEDALVAAYIGNNFRWCRRYETGIANSRARQLDEWGGRVFVILAVDSPSPELDAFTIDGWLPNYGTDGGPTVGVVLEIEPHVNGEPKRGTYIISKTADGLTNAVVMYGVQAYDLQVHIDGIASSHVLDYQQNPQSHVDCPRGSAFRYILDYDMATLLETQCNGVTTRSGAVLQNMGELPEDLPESINPGGDFFSFCTSSDGIVVMGTNEGVGYELFAVSNAQIANAVLVAGQLEQNIKLGEAEDVSLWAIEDGETLQFAKPDGYSFMFNKYRCGDLVPDGAPLTVSTTDDLQSVDTTIAPPQATTEPIQQAAVLPVYRPSGLDLNEDGTYTIRAGDNLNTIAAKLGMPVDVLVAVNGITDKRLLRVGQVIRIPQRRN